LRKMYAKIETPMDNIQLILMDLVDHIIFQSQFALYSFQKAGYTKNNYSIIYNGVNQHIFNIQNTKLWDKANKLKIIACSWSNNLAKGHKTISNFSLLKNVDISFIGNWNNQIPLNQIKLYPPMSHHEMSIIFKSHHIFLFPAEHEACPNVLLEAISCGLPVLYVDSGANKEIIQDRGIEIKKNHKDSYKEIAKQYSNIRMQLCDNINIFSIEHAAVKYLEVFKKVING